MSGVRKGLLSGVGVVVLGALALWIGREDGGDRGSGENGHAERRGLFSGKSRMKLLPAPAAWPSWFGQPEAPQARVAGKVVFEGQPVEGALVALSSQLTDAGFIAAPRLYTNGAGEFDFGELPAARYVVTAGASDRAPARRSFDTADPTLIPGADELLLTLSRCDARVTGVVSDVSGGPIAGARIRPFGERAGGTTTDPSGRFSLCIPIGGVIEVSADGYARQRRDLNAYGPMTLSLELAPEATARGRTVRADDGSPVPDVLLRAWKDLDSDAMVWVTTVSDERGAFRFDQLPPGRYRLEASSDRFTASERMELVARVGDEGEPVVCRLEAASRVVGRVVFADGSPVPGVPLMGFASGPVQVSLRAHSLADGSFVFSGLPAGDLRVSAPGYRLLDEVQQWRIVEPEHEIVVRVAAMASITGRVFRAGVPVDSAYVTAEGEDSKLNRFGTTSAGDGRYELRGLKPGTYRVKASTAHAFTRGLVVEIEEDEAHRGIDLELDLGASIAGTLSDQRGEPISGAYLKFALIGGEDWGHATSDDEGRFRALAMSGGGDYSVEVRPSVSSPLVLAPHQGETFATTRLADGSSRVEGLHLIARHDRLSISGRVVRHGGEPAPDVRIEARIAGTKPERWSTTRIFVTTGADGAFRVRDLSEGKFDLIASSFGVEKKVEGIEGGATDIVIELPAVFEINGEVAGFRSLPSVMACRLRKGCVTATARDGKFRLDGLVVGTYLVAASTTDEADQAVIEVGGDSPIRLLLRSAGSGTVAGVVSGADSSVLDEGLRCRWSLVDEDAGQLAYFTSGLRSSIPSDDGGRFEMPVPAGKPLSIHCHSKDFETRFAAKTTVAPGATAPVTLRPKSR